MTTATPLPRYTREYVNLSDLLDAMSFDSAQQDRFTELLCERCTFGDANVTLMYSQAVIECIECEIHTRHRPALRMLLDGVNFVNLEG